MAAGELSRHARRSKPVLVKTCPRENGGGDGHHFSVIPAEVGIQFSLLLQKKKEGLPPKTSGMTGRGCTGHNKVHLT